MSERDDRSEQPAEPSAGAFIETHVVPLLKEQTLGPLWVVVVGHLSAFGAWSLLVALEQGRISAYLGVFGLFWLTGTAAFMEIRQRGGPGVLTAWIAATWALTLIFFFGAKHLGIF